ncbi:MAG: DUF4435 domain-containing protein [Cytophagales bacterium]|nr:DUF4435 domain-containing protein [Cytophagales bacterium]
MSSLQENTNNSFFKGSQEYKPKEDQEISVWVENEEDVPFWFSFFNGLIPNTRFNITAPSTGERGKQSLIKHFDSVGTDLVICLDSDYDYILQTEIGIQMQDSPYIFQTYVYAIENFRCIPRNLEKVVVQATLDSNPKCDFEQFLAKYSTIVYSLFLEFLENKESDMEKLSSIFNLIFKLENDYSITSNLEQIVEREFQNSLSQSFEEKIENLGCVPTECYLFLRGHDLERKIIEILRELCGRITGLKKREIGQASTNPTEDIVAYQNKLRAVEAVLLDTDVYILQKKSLFTGKALEFFEKIENDILVYKMELENN